MNGKDIFLGLQYIGDDLIGNAETGQFPAQSQETHHHIRRPLLIAALIALLLLLVGCAVVYVLKLENVKIGTGTAQRDYSVVDGVYVEDPHTVNTTTLTLAGLKGSNAYKACADFYAYETEFRASVSVDDSGTDYRSAMDAKAKELAEQYGLKPEGQRLKFRTTRNMCDALGVERFARDNPEVSADITGGECYDTGNFSLYIDFRFPEDAGYEMCNTTGFLRWNRQDCFSQDYITLDDSGDWVERNYTTSSGSNVLILTSPSQEGGYILCDRGEALMSLALDVNPEFLSEEDAGVFSANYLHLTDRQLELVADSIDFAIHPNIPTQADVDAQAEIPNEATQDGYTLEVKSVETDGYVAEILIGVTAPEDIVFTPEDHLLFGNYGDHFVPADGSAPPLSMMRGISTVDDGDGKANTATILLTQSIPAEGIDAPFAAGSTWNLHLIDLICTRWDSSEVGYPTDTTLAEGEWLFPIVFGEDSGD